MGDKIDFPYNNKMYFRYAKECMENHKYNEALEAIKKVYAQDKNPQVIHLYTLILYTMEYYEEALEVINDHHALFKTNEEFTILYVMVLIQTRQFIEVEVIINKHLEKHTSAHEEIWKNLQTDFLTERDRFNTEIEQKKVETKQALAQLEDYPPHQQNAIILNAQHLHLKDLNEIAPRIFAHPYLNGLIKRAFLERLIEKKDDTIYLFPWFNENKEIVPKDSYSFSEEPNLKAIEKILQRKVIKTPELYEPIYTEILNDLLMLYPFIDEVITDRVFWVETYISLVKDTEQEHSALTPKNQEQTTMLQWIEKLNVIAQRK